MNGATPPVTVPMVSDPLFCPHDASDGVTFNPVGQHAVLVISIILEYTQPLASLTVMVYDPAERLLKFLPLLNPPFSIEYSYGALPPVTPLITIEPSSLPHVAFVGEALMAVGPPALFTVTGVEYSQPFASFTEIVCEPDARFVKLVVLP